MVEVDQLDGSLGLVQLLLGVACLVQLYVCIYGLNVVNLLGVLQLHSILLISLVVKSIPDHLKLTLDLSDLSLELVLRLLHSVSLDLFMLLL